MRIRMIAVLILVLGLVMGGALTAGADDQQWQEVTSGYAGIQTDWWSVPAIADLDADGDQDMLLGNGRYISYYRNDGSPYVPQWTFVTPAYNGIYIQNNCVAPSLADVDGDSDYDLVIAACGAKVYFYRNDGTPQVPSWTFVTDNYVPVPLSGCSHVPTFADMDADADLDLFLDSCDWIAHYFENTGSASSANYNLSIYDFVQSSVGLQWYGNYIAAEDIDLDGDLDILASNTSGALAFLRNTGSSSSPSWSLATTQFPGLYTSHTADMGYIFPAFVDIDADGQDEVIMGDLDGYLSFFENISEPVATVEADVNIHPETLNLCSQGRWISSVVTLPEGSDPADVVVESVRVGGVMADAVNVEGNSIVVKFPRAEIVRSLSSREGDVELTVRGKVGEENFIGTDSLRLVSCNGGKSKGRILIVSDDDAQGYYGEFKTDLETLEVILDGYNYTVHKESEVGYPSLSLLQSFDIVVWTTGVVWGEAPDDVDRETLKQYVAQGGNLFMTSTWAAYDAYYANDEDFLNNVLHAEYTAWMDQVDMEIVDASHPIASGFTQGEIINFDYPLIYENDVVYPANGSVSVIGRGPNSYDPEASMVLAYEDDLTRVAYVASPLYLLPSAERQLLTENIISWLSAKNRGKGKK